MATCRLNPGNPFPAAGCPCERLKKDELTRDIPVIFISAPRETIDKVKAFSTGGVDYITKLFQKEEVPTRVETHLSPRSLQKTLEKKMPDLDRRNRRTGFGKKKGRRHMKKILTDCRRTPLFKIFSWMIAHWLWLFLLWPGVGNTHDYEKITIQLKGLHQDLIEIGCIKPGVIRRIADAYAELELAPGDHGGAPEGFVYRPSEPEDDPLSLTREERVWLAENHTVRVRIEYSPPISINDPEPDGMAVDYLKAVGGIIGIDFRFVPARDPWIDGFEDVGGEHRLYDLEPEARRTEERLQHYAMTDPWYSAPWAIFTRNDVTDIRDMADLTGREVAVERGYVMHKKLSEAYPRL
ncbi:MAG: transporter substrate-binding domain-containing protein, partial [Desulfobacterales bacterium]|nr:transporter substrate-binding domain-containing protein [Desulfobacterales bacterium]